MIWYGNFQRSLKMYQIKIFNESSIDGNVETNDWYKKDENL